MQASPPPPQREDRMMVKYDGNIEQFAYEGIEADSESEALKIATENAFQDLHNKKSKFEVHKNIFQNQDLNNDCWKTKATAQSNGRGVLVKHIHP